MDGEEARLIKFVNDGGENPNILLDNGLESAIKEDLAILKRISKERY